jgi:hypothetical protein
LSVDATVTRSSQFNPLNTQVQTNETTMNEHIANTDIHLQPASDPSLPKIIATDPALNPNGKTCIDNARKLGYLTQAGSGLSMLDITDIENLVVIASDDQGGSLVDCALSPSKNVVYVAAHQAPASKFMTSVTQQR